MLNALSPVKSLDLGLVPVPFRHVCSGYGVVVYSLLNCLGCSLNVRNCDEERGRSSREKRAVICPSASFQLSHPRNLRGSGDERRARLSLFKQDGNVHSCGKFSLATSVHH